LRISLDSFKPRTLARSRLISSISSRHGPVFSQARRSGLEHPAAQRFRADPELWRQGLAGSIDGRVFGQAIKVMRTARSRRSKRRHTRGSIWFVKPRGSGTSSGTPPHGPNPEGEHPHCGTIASLISDHCAIYTQFLPSDCCVGWATRLGGAVLKVVWWVSGSRPDRRAHAGCAGAGGLCATSPAAVSVCALSARS
jgi:hypothetical protein